MSIGPVNYVGLVSGLEWDKIIEAIIEQERRPLEIIQEEISEYQQKLSAWQDIRDKLNSFLSFVRTINELNELLLRKATVSDESIIRASASSDAEPGSHKVVVHQLAKSHQVKSRGWADTDTTAINGTFFRVYVGGNLVADITVTSDMTLADLVNAINNATDEVRASIIDDGTPTNPYHLLLTSTNTGASNQISIEEDTDLTFGDFDPDGPWDYYVEAAEWDTWNGTSTPSSNEGAGNYTGTTEKTIKFKIESVNGDTTVGTSGTVGTDTIVIKWWDGEGNSGTITIDNTYVPGTFINVIDGVQTAYSAGTLVVGDIYYIDTHIYEVQAAQDASVEIDGMGIVSEDNTIEDVIPGVTIELLKADPSTEVILTVENDKEAVKSKIKEFVNKYNEVIATINTYDYYNSETETAGILFGDSTTHYVKFGLAEIITEEIAPLPSDFSLMSLADIGFDLGTNALLSIDEDELDEALDEHFDEVVQLFTLSWDTTNPAVQYYGKTRDTPSGYYEVTGTFDASGNLTDATINFYDKDHNLIGTYTVAAGDLQISNEPAGGVIVGVNPDIEGIRILINDPDGNGTEQGEIRLSLGAACKVENAIDYWTDEYSTPKGIIPTVIDSINQQIDELEDRAEQWEERLSNMEGMYYTIFSKMEEFISAIILQEQMLAGYTF